MSFKVGDKVVCINDKNQREIFELKEGNFYEIIGFNPYFDAVFLKGCVNYGNTFTGYWSYRFRKLDYDFVEEVIKQVKPQTVEI